MLPDDRSTLIGRRWRQALLRLGPHALAAGCRQNHACMWSPMGTHITGKLMQLLATHAGMVSYANGCWSMCTQPNEVQIGAVLVHFLFLRAGGKVWRKNSYSSLLNPLFVMAKKKEESKTALRELGTTSMCIYSRGLSISISHYYNLHSHIQHWYSFSY